jgi:hypothetical protein
MSRAPERCDSDADHRFHRSEWRIQRIGWVLVALFLAWPRRACSATGRSVARTLTAPAGVSNTNDLPGSA